MALTCNPELQAQLDATGTKLEWSNTVINYLGNTRRLRCWRDSNASATDPVTTGTLFLNVGLTGAMTASAGVITGFGAASDTVTRQAADLLTGKAILRIEGGGHWVQGTLGLTKAAQMAAGVLEADVKTYDFMFSANPSATAGIGFSKGAAKIQPPPLIPSGTGPTAPAIRSATPTVIQLEDWTNPASPVVVGTATFSVRDLDWVFEHPDMAAEMGDIAVYKLDNTIQWTGAGFELGGLLFLGNNANTIDGVTPLEQMVLGFKPIGRWASYPAMDTFTRALWTQTGTSADGHAIFECSNPSTADTTYPPPFKIRLKTAGGTEVHVHEMKAFNQYPTLPINSPEFLESNQAVLQPNGLYASWQVHGKPAVPHFNCGMMLPWENIRTRLSSRYQRYFPGVGARSYGSKVAKDTWTSNASHAFDDAYTQRNGMNHMYAMPPYPMAADKNGSDSTEVATYDPTPRDPGLFNVSSSNAYYGKPHRFSGWKYQPGSVSGHDWYMGKGGQRFDRSAVPSVLAIYASDQNWVRPHGSVPIRDLLEGYSFAFFNHSCFLLRDAKNGTTIPKSEVHAGRWTLANAYYGAYTNPPALPTDPQYKVDACGIKSGSGRKPQHHDASGRLPWGGYLRDSLHSYHYPAWMTLMLNSPMHAYANVFFYNMQWMCALGSSAPTANPRSYYLHRPMAWRWLAYTMQWIVGTQHPLGISQTMVEERFQIELEKIYDQIIVPVHVNNSQEPWAVSLRNLGVYIEATGTSLSSFGGTMGLYVAHTLAVMKQTGLWAKMKGRSQKCKSALEETMKFFDKQIIDYILDTKGRDPYYQVLTPVQAEGYVWTAADIPANWTAQAAMLDTHYPVHAADTPATVADDYPTVQSYANFNTHYTGTKQDQGSTQHLQYQYVTIRKHYFPEYPHPRLEAALTKYADYYAENANQADTTTKAEWRIRFPSHGDLLAPSVVGPN